jgi:pimeloyl-ACP methyl ester carboxylesterase
MIEDDKDGMRLVVTEVSTAEAIGASQGLPARDGSDERVSMTGTAGRKHYAQDLETTAASAGPRLGYDRTIAVGIEGPCEDQVVLVQELTHPMLRAFDAPRVAVAMRKALLEVHEIDVAAIVFVKPASLPRTTSGKLRRGKTRQLFQAGELAEVARWERPPTGPAPAVEPLHAAPVSVGEANRLGASPAWNLARHRSKDGTSLSYRCSGAGSYIFFVHGSATDGRRWLPVLPLFETRFTACVLDRRGHGQSGDATSYCIEAEFNDIASLTAAHDLGPADVVAHSYGALCALGAACRGARIRRLVLYEPPVPMQPGSYFRPGLTGTMREAIARNDNEAAIEAFAADALALSPDEIYTMRRLATWSALVRHAALILRELENVERFVGQAALFRECRVPTLLLIGGASPPQYRATAEALSAVLPSSRIEILPTQSHGAMNTAPKLFVDKIIEFLTTAMV